MLERDAVTRFRRADLRSLREVVADVEGRCGIVGFGGARGAGSDVGIVSVTVASAEAESMLS